MLAAGTTTWDSLADESYIGRMANLGLIPWSTILGGSYDDAQVRVSLCDVLTPNNFWFLFSVGHSCVMENVGLQSITGRRQQLFHRQWLYCLLRCFAVSETEWTIRTVLPRYIISLRNSGMILAAAEVSDLHSAFSSVVGIIKFFSPIKCGGLRQKHIRMRSRTTCSFLLLQRDTYGLKTRPTWTTRKRYFHFRLFHQQPSDTRLQTWAWCMFDWKIISTITHKGLCFFSGTIRNA